MKKLFLLLSFSLLSLTACFTNPKSDVFSGIWRLNTDTDGNKVQYYEAFGLNIFRKGTIYNIEVVPAQPPKKNVTLGESIKISAYYVFKDEKKYAGQYELSADETIKHLNRNIILHYNKESDMLYNKNIGYFKRISIIEKIFFLISSMSKKI